MPELSKWSERKEILWISNWIHHRMICLHYHRQTICSIFSTSKIESLVDVTVTVTLMYTEERNSQINVLKATTMTRSNSQIFIDFHIFWIEKENDSHTIRRMKHLQNNNEKNTWFYDKRSHRSIYDFSNIFKLKETSHPSIVFTNRNRLCETVNDIITSYIRIILHSKNRQITNSFHE